MKAKLFLLNIISFIGLLYAADCPSLHYINFYQYKDNGFYKNGVYSSVNFRFDSHFSSWEIFGGFQRTNFRADSFSQQEEIMLKYKNLLYDKIPEIGIKIGHSENSVFNKSVLIEIKKRLSYGKFTYSSSPAVQFIKNDAGK